MSNYLNDRLNDSYAQFNIRPLQHTILKTMCRRSITQLILTVKIGDESRYEKRCERINRLRGKAATINFVTFKRTSIHSSIGLTCLWRVSDSEQPPRCSAI